MNPIHPAVAAIIIHYGSAEDTVTAAVSVASCGYAGPFRIFVVDNEEAGGGNSIAAIFAKKFPQGYAEIVPTPGNDGYAAGVNAGIRAAHSASIDGKPYDYFLVLNNDIETEQGFLEKLVSTAQKTGAGMTTGKILYHADRGKIWYAGGYISTLRGSGFSTGLDTIDPASVARTEKPADITFVSGCMMLIARDAVDRAGMLDRAYFLYLEDTDYSVRVSRAGFRLVYEPAARIYHKVNASTGAGSPVLWYYNLRNRIYFMRKNFGGARYAIFRLYLETMLVLKRAMWRADGNQKMIEMTRRALVDADSGCMGKYAGSGASS